MGPGMTLSSGASAGVGGMSFAPFGWIGMISMLLIPLGRPRTNVSTYKRQFQRWGGGDVTRTFRNTLCDLFTLACQPSYSSGFKLDSSPSALYKEIAIARLRSAPGLTPKMTAAIRGAKFYPKTDRVAGEM